MCALLPVFPGVPWVDALQLEMQVGTDRLSQLLWGQMFLGVSIRGREGRVPWSSLGLTWLHSVVCVPGSGGWGRGIPGVPDASCAKAVQEGLGRATPGSVGGRLCD